MNHLSKAHCGISVIDFVLTWKEFRWKKEKKHYKEYFTRIFVLKYILLKLLIDTEILTRFPTCIFFY